MKNSVFNRIIAFILIFCILFGSSLKYRYKEHEVYAFAPVLAPAAAPFVLTIAFIIVTSLLLYWGIELALDEVSELAHLVARKLAAHPGYIQSFKDNPVSIPEDIVSAVESGITSVTPDSFPIIVSNPETIKIAAIETASILHDYVNTGEIEYSKESSSSSFYRFLKKIDSDNGTNFENRFENSDRLAVPSSLYNEFTIAVNNIAGKPSIVYGFYAKPNSVWNGSTASSKAVPAIIFLDATHAADGDKIRYISYTYADYNGTNVVNGGRYSFSQTYSAAWADSFIKPFTFTPVSINASSSILYGDQILDLDSDNIFENPSLLDDFLNRVDSIAAAGISDVVLDPAGIRDLDSLNDKENERLKEVIIPFDYDFVYNPPAVDDDLPIEDDPPIEEDAPADVDAKVEVSLPNIFWKNLQSIFNWFGNTFIGNLKSLDTSAFKVNASKLKTLFPFSIPFDLISCISNLRAPPKCPVFTYKLSDIRCLASAGIKDIKIDFSEYAAFTYLFTALKFFEYIIFIAGLIRITRNIIRG